MPPEHTMGDILMKMREIVSDEPSDGFPQRPSRGADMSEDSLNEAVIAPMPRAQTRNGAPPENSAFSAGILEAVFTGAVREAITPTAQQWVNSHQAELIDALKPMIRSWMDERLPQIVENTLKQELGRAIMKHLRQ
jgi:cell pole-organizing protein PopZ